MARAKAKVQETLNLDAILFKCRDILRKAHNSGSFFEKRDIMLTLVFLRFIGEKFEDGVVNLRNSLEKEGLNPDDPDIRAAFLDDPTFVDGTYNLPKEARWQTIINTPAPRLNVALDDALRSIAETNSQLKGCFVEGSFTSRNLAPIDIKQLVDEVNKISHKAFGEEKDLIGHVYEYFLREFAVNATKEEGEFYTPHDVVQLIASMIEPFDGTLYDQAAGTGGMLSTAYSYFKHYNPTADVKLFGVEFMGVSWAVGMAEMLIKGQDATNFVHADSFKEDPSADTKVRFVLMNPPFGTPWSGKDAKAGQEEAVREEHDRENSRWGAGLPSGGDSQMLFLQSAIAKLDEKVGRAAIIENGSPLFTGATASGESQIRRWLLENDLLEAIVAMPTDPFYNTGIASYWWILSKNKRKERRGYVQLIDATNMYHKLRKPVGNKKNEFSPEDRAQIAKLYTDFDKADPEYSKIFKNEDFMYREYTVMQPLQRSYAITEESIERMLQKGALKGLWDEAKVAEYEMQGNALKGKDASKLKAFYAAKPRYDAILAKLKAHVTDEKWLSPKAFTPVLQSVLGDTADKKTFEKIMDGLSKMDKTAEIQRDKKGNIIYDKETKDIEIVKYTEDIETYMAREVLPHIPDAKWFWEEDLTKKKPVIKTGAEIPFTRYFYKYQAPKPSGELLAEFLEIEKAVNERMARLLK